MSALHFQFHHRGIHLPALKLWLDPHDIIDGPERVFVSHAHSDHTAPHREVILTAPTAHLMHARLGGNRLETVLPFNQPESFHDDSSPFPWRITLLPAGHIFGSAMAWIEAEGESLLYTGDFKLRPGRSAETCDARAARGVGSLIMETTFGRPHYRFPPAEEVLAGIIRFCEQALDNDETPVLLGYSLGKSQEILQGLAGAGLPIALHGAVYRLTRIFEQFGQSFPAYERYDPATARGKVLLCPPNVANSAMLRNLGRVRTAVLTGWAVDPGCRFRYQVDAAFPLSDHADFPELIELVQQLAPQRVFTLHGFAAEFAATLRSLGFEARALSENEQLELALMGGAAGSRPMPAVEVPSTMAATAGAGPEPGGLADSFSCFAATCAAIAGTSSKLEKIRVLAEYLPTVPDESMERAVTWFTGQPFSSNENRVLQLGWALLRDALCAVGGLSESELHQVYLKHSDLGETAFDVFQSRPSVHATLSLREVRSLFEELQVARGPTGKLPVLIRGLERCSPLEAKFLVKVITGDLRIGLKEGLVEEAVALACQVTAEEVRQTNLLIGNIGETAALARRGELKRATLTPFRPVKFMLATPEETAVGIWDRIHPAPENANTDQGAAAVLSETASEPRDVWVEDKYDGIRCQLHKAAGRVALYSRDLKDITGTFLDVADAARALANDVILDGELLAMRGSQVLPFADLQKRLGRREGDLFMGEEIPVRFMAFDLLWCEGEDFLRKPLRERRTRLEKLLGPANSSPADERALRLAGVNRAASAAEIESAFTAARERRNEGLMVKDPESFYTPGRRGLAWLKLKKALATLDCVVVGAEYGHGKRNKVLSDYTFAVRDDDTGELKTIGKAYSGLTDVEIARLTEYFLSRVIREEGRFHAVEPEVVLEIAFDRIQRSERHTSGLAMRFPRIVRIREDKTVADIDTVATARRLVGG